MIGNKNMLFSIIVGLTALGYFYLSLLTDAKYIPFSFMAYVLLFVISVIYFIQSLRKTPRAHLLIIAMGYIILFFHIQIIFAAIVLSFF